MWAPWNLLVNCWMLSGIGVSMVSIVSPFTLLSLLIYIDGSGQYDQDKRNETNNKSTLISHDLITAAYGALIEGTTNSNPGFVCAAGSCWTWSVFFVTCLQKLDPIDAMYSQWLYQLIAKSQWKLKAICCVYQSWIKLLNISSWCVMQLGDDIPGASMEMRLEQKGAYEKEHGWQMGDRHWHGES